MIPIRQRARTIFANKSKIHFNNSENIEELKTRFISEIQKIQTQTLTEVLREFAYSQDVNG